MVYSQATKTRSVYFTLSDLIDNFNERQRDFLRGVLECKFDLSDISMIITSDGRLCLFCVCEDDDEEPF